MRNLFIFIFCILSVGRLWAQDSKKENTTALRDGEAKLIKLNLSNVDLGEPADLTGKIFNLSFPIFKINNDSSTYLSIVAAPLGVANGDYDLTVNSSKGQISEIQVPVQSRVDFKTEEVLETPEESVLPTQGKIIDQISREDLELKSVFKVTTPERYWDEKFIEPVKSGKKNSPFGIYRVYSNHLRRRTHWGVDYKVSIGTGVFASAGGVVALANDLYFPGKTIVIDHGLGVFTGYSHLKSMKVKVGDRVKIGQKIGQSGRTGKVTGPHLHWFAVVGRVKVDPLSLLKINLRDEK